VLDLHERKMVNFGASRVQVQKIPEVPTTDLRGEPEVYLFSASTSPIVCADITLCPNPWVWNVGLRGLTARLGLRF
jgi:hypothetical protein